MTSSLHEYLGVASSGRHWNVGGYRLWESTEPGTVLYMAHSLRLAEDQTGRLRAAISQFQKWQETGYEITGGSVMLTLSADPSNDLVAFQRLKDDWRRVLLNGGYTSCPDPRFVPLSASNARLQVFVDPTHGRSLASSDEQESLSASWSVMLELTSSGAEVWGRAIKKQGAVSGGLRLTYRYPQLAPTATATVQLRGLQSYSAWSATLARSTDATLHGSAEEIRSAWNEMKLLGVIEVQLAGDLLPEEDAHRQELTNSFAEQALERWFETLFTPHYDSNGTSYQAGDSHGARYALRWRSRADATDLSLTLSYEGWVWMDASSDVDFTTLLRNVHAEYLKVVYLEVPVPVSFVVDGDPLLASVAASLNFSDGRVSEVPVFGNAGGARQFIVSSARPDAVSVSYKANVSFTPPNWPVVESGGVAVWREGGYIVKLRPSTWVRRQTVYLYIRRGNRISRSDETDPADYLTLTATYEADYFKGVVRHSARITPSAPIEFAYPCPPDSVPGRARLSALGVVGGKMVRSAELTLDENETEIFLLADDESVQLVGRNAVIAESNLLVQRLRVAGARPVTSTNGSTKPATAESGRFDISYDVALVPQPTPVSCWAAALTMVVSFRDKASYDPQTIAEQGGLDLETGYGWSSIRNAVAAWNLMEEGPRSAMPAEWERLLRQWGPIWIVEIGAPYHAVVLAGMRGDGTPEDTVVTLYNPWPPNQGAIEYKTFLDFDNEFGLGAGAGAAMVRGQP